MLQNGPNRPKKGPNSPSQPSNRPKIGPKSSQKASIWPEIGQKCFRRPSIDSQLRVLWTISCAFCWQTHGQFLLFLPTYSGRTWEFPGEQATSPPSLFCITPTFACPRPTPEEGGGLSKFPTGSRGPMSSSRKKEGGRVIFPSLINFSRPPCHV